MSSITFQFRPHVRDNGQCGRLFVRVIYQRRTANITLPYKLGVNEWDPVAHDIHFAGASPSRLPYLREVVVGMATIRQELEEILDNLSRTSDFVALDIAHAYRCRLRGLWAVAEKLSQELALANRMRTAKAYLSAARSLLAFMGKQDLAGTDFTPKVLKAYERSMEEKGLSRNTISFYMRNLRAMFNKAVDRGIFTRTNINPFKDVFTGVAVTPKRALEQKEVGKIVRLEKEETPLPATEKETLQLFLFALHAQGMSFVDMAYLKKSDIRNGEIIYRRKKTGQYVRICLTPTLRQYINCFKSRTKDSEYVFPIITDPEKSAYRQYCNGLTLQNRRLKLLARRVDIESLSMHQARHTWATTARRQGIPEEVISEGLGHHSVKTTRIYLGSFEQSVVREAMRKVSAAVCRV